MNSVAELGASAPFYYEARDYCDRFGIDSPEEGERVRLSMCVQEYRRRMEPWIRNLARLRAMTVAESPEFLAGVESLREIGRVEAKALGLNLDGEELKP